MNNYRRAFVAAFAMNIVLAAGLGWLWWRDRAASHPKSMPPASPAAETTSNGGIAEMPLVPVQLTAERMQSIGVKTGTVDYRNVSNEIRAVGNVAADERRMSYVQLRFAGWIRKVFADATYDYVRKGQPLFTIYSSDLATTEQELLLARKNGNLLAQSTVPGVASGAASLVEAAGERLKQWNVPEREIARLESTDKVADAVEIDSPASGFITERNALPNLYAQPETRLYKIADLSSVWVYAEIFQNDIGQIKIGDPATVTTDAYPGREFAGRVDAIYPEVDVSTRTVKIRLVFANARLGLKPGMFVNVDLKVPLGRQLVVPASAVFHSGTRTLVFVDRGNGYIEPRDVELGPQAGEQFIVLKGLKAGEQIVTSANFLIDSESQLQAAMGSFVPPPPGAGAAAAMNAPQGQARIEFTSVPSPLRKGENTIQIRLADNRGEPVGGAVVTITLFSPAMPAMGMASARAEATLADKGQGVYEGAVNFERGGKWQVAILARKNGQTFATKQITVNAEGSM